MVTQNATAAWPEGGDNGAGVRRHPVTAALTRAKAGQLPGELRFCLFLVWYFTLGGTILKLLPPDAARLLRYLPELLLYITAFRALFKARGFWRIPVFWPLLICALTMAFSALRNASPPLAMAQNYYQAFRFLAFAVILWRSQFEPGHIPRVIDNFLKLAVIELFVGLCELVGGGDAKAFFVPNMDAGGTGQMSSMEIFMLHGNEPGYLAGTLPNYNGYGMFMCVAMLFAMAMHGIYKKAGYQVMAWAMGVAVVLSFSRHSLISMAVILVMFLLFHRKRGALLLYFKRLVVLAALGGVLFASSQDLRDSLSKRLETITSGQVLMNESNARLMMIVLLTPRFLATYPFFGQGPFEYPLGAGGQDVVDLGPTIKAAPNLPGTFTHYLHDVVWLEFVGAYGLIGLLARMLVYGAVILAAMRLRKARIRPEYTLVAETCIIIMTVFIIAGLFSQEIEARENAAIFWCLVGMMFSITARYMPNRQKVPRLAATGKVKP